jgi:flagella basal body P-ring formation protein FlgA
MRALLILVALAGPAAAESLVATRVLPAGTVVAPGDLALVDAEIAGALTRVDEAAGRETRVAIYPGRPLRAADLQAPTLVDRNARVEIVYRRGALTILAEGRALDRAGAGEALRVMNLASRSTVTGRVGEDGRVHVGGEGS